MIALPLLALLSAAIVRLMISAGVMDRPGARSAHSHPTPKGGGIGIVVATLAGLLVLGAGRSLLALGAAGLCIAVISWLDDLWSWPFSVKLAAQVLAALVAAAGGAVVTGLPCPGIGTVPLGVFSWPATICWFVVVTNAVNFMDGLNGLAAGSVGLASLALAIVAAMSGAAAVALAGLTLAAGIIGFLPFNYPRARVFMGDVGSQFCGVMIAGLGLLAAQDGLSVLIMPALLAGLLFDVTFTLARRALAGDRLTEAHRGHLYQVANRSRLPAAWISVIEWGFVVWGAGTSLVITRLGEAWAWPALAVALLPQPVWLAVVAVRARRARLGRW